MQEQSNNAAISKLMLSWSKSKDFTERFTISPTRGKCDGLGTLTVRLDGVAQSVVDKISLTASGSLESNFEQRCASEATSLDFVTMDTSPDSATNDTEARSSTKAASRTASPNTLTVPEAATNQRPKKASGSIAYDEFVESRYDNRQSYIGPIRAL